MSLNPFAGFINRGWFSFGRDDQGQRIFVSYRREDARGDAGRLTDNLKAHFGDKQIFRDIEAIEPGLDFVEAINKAVSSSAVLLAIIGPQWLKVVDQEGRRRIDDPNDFVRLEIAAALSRNIRVVPVLVGGVAMPKAEELPAPLESFSRRQAHELSDGRWEYDVGQLMETLEKAGIDPLPKPRPHPNRDWWRRHRIAVGVGGVLLVIAASVYSEFQDDIEELISPPIPPPTVDLGTGIAPQSDPRPALPTSRPPTTPRPTVRPALSYSGLDAIGRFPTVVQVFNPG